MRGSPWSRLLPVLLLGACQNSGTNAQPAPSAVATAAVPATPPAIPPTISPASPLPVSTPGTTAAGPEAPVPTDSLAAPADPRITRAAAACSADRRAVVVAGEKVSALADLPAAVAAASDHSLVWACPGVHAITAPLTVEGREDLTIAGAGAVLVAIDQARLLDLEDSAQLTVRGLRFMQVSGEEPTLIAAARVRGLVVDDCRLDGWGRGVGLRLDATTGAVIRGTLLMNLTVAIERHGGDTTVRGVRFLGNAAEVAGDLARAALEGGNTIVAPAAEARAPVLPAAALPDLKAAFSTSGTWPIIARNDRRYAVLDIELTPKTEPCVDGDGQRMACPDPIPFTGALPAGITATTIQSLQTVTPAGPCTMTGGTPIVLDTTGCDNSYALVVPLTGCADSLPFATTATLPAELRWVPRVEGLRGTLMPEALPSALRPWLAERLRDSLADLALLAVPASVAVEWTVAAGSERWTSWIAGAQIPVDECQPWQPWFIDTWVETDGGPRTSVMLPMELFHTQRWAGALAMNGKLVAMLGESQTSLSLFARQPDGSFASAWSKDYWDDNDECIISYGPLGFSAPCAP
jgi:hypothetical protein